MNTSSAFVHRQAVRGHQLAKKALHKWGLELRRLDPQASLDLLLITMINEFDITCAVDVGANTGQFAATLRLAGYRGPIVSFEPVPSTFKLLEKNSSHDPKWQAVELALGSKTDTLTVNIPEGHNLASFLNPSDAAVERWDFMSTSQRSVTVRVCRLDSVLPDLVAENSLRRIFLKVDAQGWDLEVIKGSVDFIGQVTLLQTELSFKPIYENGTSYRTTIDYLDTLGFEMVGLYPVVRDFNWSLIEADGVFVKRDARPN